MAPPFSWHFSTGESRMSPVQADQTVNSSSGNEALDTKNRREEDNLDALRNLSSDAERKAYLDGACANDLGLRARVEALYQAYGDERNFVSALTLPGPGHPGVLEARLAEGPMGCQSLIARESSRESVSGERSAKP